MSNDAIFIHTFEMKYKLKSYDDLTCAKNFKYNKKRSKKQNKKVYTYNPNITGVRFEYYETNKKQYKDKLLVAIFNPSKVLDKSELTLNDYFTFEKKYRLIISQFIPIKIINRGILTRIDYFYDVTFSPHHKKIILKLYKKLISKYKGMHKTAYKSSIYYNSKSKNNNIYSRYEKIIDIMVAENFTNPKLVDVEKEIVPFINEKK
jgi:hypothetical protein